MEKGILTIQAVGNSGFSELKTVVSVAPWLFTVGASSTGRKIINKLILGNRRTFISSTVNPFITGKHNKRLVYGKGITRYCNESSAKQCIEGCIDPHLVKKKIVVCDVADVDSLAMTFAMEANASGIILRKNKSERDNFLTSTFPTASLYNDDFHYLNSYLKSKRNPSAQILKSETIHSTRTPIVASFSKRGPNIILPGILKPDVVAPGINILAQCPIEKSLGEVPGKYSIQSGTSMACPHVAGASVYVKSKHLNWSPSAIKSSLVTTAWNMNVKYNVDAELGYGAGHIHPMKAVYPGLVYETFIVEYTNMFCTLGAEVVKLRKMLGAKHKCSKGKKVYAKDVNYPTMTAPVNTKSSFNIQFKRVVTNIGNANSTYHLQINTGDSAIYINVEPIVLSFVRLNERKAFTVTVSGQWLNQDHVSCSLVWFDGTHKVKSPILLYRSSI